MGTTYSEAGVDVQAIRKSQESIGRLIRQTHHDASTIHGFGHYAGLVKMPGGKMLATHTDGVGTKAIIATQMKKYDTIGIDCIAMNVNDVVCVGAAPVSFVDYIAANSNEQPIFEQLMKGLVEGAKTARVPIVGGETAVMPDVFAGEGFAFDLAGTVVGLADPDHVILGNDITAGDVIIGVRSSGLHSNGYSLARRVLFPKYSIHDNIRGVGMLGDALLEPTAIYAQPVLDTISECVIHGLAHITGGSFAKLSRLSDAGFEIDAPPPVPPIMGLIAEHVDDEEMHRTFNMGVGFCVVAPGDEADVIRSIFARHNMDSDVIGHVSRRRGVRVGQHTLA